MNQYFVLFAFHVFYSIKCDLELLNVFILSYIWLRFD
jgi:hypothetical protein